MNDPKLASSASGESDIAADRQVPQWTCCEHRAAACKDKCQIGEPICFPMSGECAIAEGYKPHK